MGYKPIMSKPAKKDIAVISAYKSQFYAATLNRFYNAFEDTYKKVAENPYMYPAYEHNQKYRKAVFLDYVMFYRVFESSNTVRIYRIIHGKMDIGKYLQQ